MTPRPYLSAICGVLALQCIPAVAQNPPSAQTPLNERVLVVYNSNVADSLNVAKYYMAERKIPQANRCKITVSSIEYLDQREFELRVKTPIRHCLETVGIQKILYIVFSFQTPYVIMLKERGFALDQFVADIWDEYGGMRPGTEIGPNPYYAAAQSQKDIYPPFVSLADYREQPRAAKVYSVWRLDAATADLAKRLVYYAMFAETNGLTGRGCFDLQVASLDGVVDTGAASGEWDIRRSAEFTRRAGFPVTEDGEHAEFGTPPAPLRCEGAAFYAGWYSLNHYNDAFTWVPGAIGFHLDSASAGNPRGGPNWSANAVMKGITITGGAVGEPYLEGLTHPDQVFLDLFRGANVGDALLRSTHLLKWMIVNIGDPLYRPFPQGIGPFKPPAK